MSDSGERVGGSVEAVVPGPRAGDSEPQQDNGGSGGAAPRFTPGQTVELAVQVGSWKEGTPCKIVAQEPATGVYEWRAKVYRDSGSVLEASFFEHELRPRKPSRLEKLCARVPVDDDWLTGYKDWATARADGEAASSADSPGTDEPWSVPRDPFGAAVDSVFAEAEQLLMSKHADYGPRNISAAPGGPLMGLAVRLHDKLSRLTHLLQTEGEPNHESLRDTLLDIMCYGSIGVLVSDGDWPTA